MLDIDCTQEVWKDIVGHEGYYQVSNMGRVKSLTRTIEEYDPRWGRVRRKRLRERILRGGARKNGKGYLSVSLSRDNKIRPRGEVHRLVLETFVGSCPKGMVACHRDGDRFNNKLSNLRWDTQKNNCTDNIANGTKLQGKNHPCYGKPGFQGEHHPSVKLSEMQVKKLLRMWSTGKYKQKELADVFDVSVPTISMIVNGKLWKHIRKRTVHHSAQ